MKHFVYLFLFVISLFVMELSGLAKPILADEPTCPSGQRWQGIITGPNQITYCCHVNSDATESCSGATGACSNGGHSDPGQMECVGSTTPPAGGTNSTTSSPVEILAPKDWLLGLIPGNGISGATINGNSGLDFISKGIIPLIINLLLFFTIVLALIFLLLGGIGLITSGGNKEGTAKAKGTITYALVGLVLGLGSFIILNVVGTIFSITFF